MPEVSGGTRRDQFEVWYLDRVPKVRERYMVSGVQASVVVPASELRAGARRKLRHRGAGVSSRNMAVEYVRRPRHGRQG